MPETVGIPTGFRQVSDIFKSLHRNNLSLTVGKLTVGGCKQVKNCQMCRKVLFNTYTYICKNKVSTLPSPTVNSPTVKRKSFSDKYINMSETCRKPVGVPTVNF